jgi:hypothetical protein
MTQYTAPQRAPRLRRGLSHRTLIVLAAGFLLPASLLAIARTPVNAAPSNNPIFATIQDVQDAINAALAPIQNAIADLQTQQTNQASQISDLQTQQQNQAQQITSLQNSTGKALHVYDANGQDLGIAANSSIFIPSLSRFISFLFNSNAVAGSYPDQGYIYFSSTDCTGPAYIVPSDANPPTTTSNVLTFDGQHFYIYPNLAPSTQITVGSAYYWDHNYNQPRCSPNPIDNQPHKAYTLQQVKLPFTTPVAWPLQYKYQ